ncbi:DNA cytosine methyltransferase [Escherichia coli]
MLVGFRRDSNLKADFTLRDISECFPAQRVTLAQLLDPMVEAKYIRMPCCGSTSIHMRKNIRRAVTASVMEWFIRTSAKRHPYAVCALLQRWRGNFNRLWLDMATGEKDFDDPLNQQHRPRRLTPRECARLMGFEAPGEAKFRIPVSDTQAYRQFGNSVVVPVFAAVAKTA